MTSVCLSVTLVDCDHIVQQKVEIGTWQDRLMSHSDADPDYNILWFTFFTVCKCGVFFISAAFVGSHVALSQHLLADVVDLYWLYWLVVTRIIVTSVHRWVELYVDVIKRRNMTGFIVSLWLVGHHIHSHVAMLLLLLTDSCRPALSWPRWKWISIQHP